MYSAFFISLFLESDIYCYLFPFALHDQAAKLKCLLRCHFRTETLFTKGETYSSNMACQDPCHYLYSIFKPFEKSIDHNLWDLLTQKVNTNKDLRPFTGNMKETYVSFYITLKIDFSLAICYCCISSSKTADK